MKQTVGIIGGSGYVGYSIANYLKNDYKIKILDIFPPSQRMDPRISYKYCDILKIDNIKNYLYDVDIVINTAIIQIPLINEEIELGYNVNINGTQNICEVIKDMPNVKGLLLTGTWHCIGEKEINGIIDEEFGFRPDKVETRAKLYALSKIAQESIIRFYDEMSDKVYGIIRLGTVLGDGMPKKTAANIFIERGLKGQSITPFKHSMYRPMLYVDIRDVCYAFKKYVSLILNDKINDRRNSLGHIVNIYYHKPITILDLSVYVKDIIIEITNGVIKPDVEVIDTGEKIIFDKNDINKFKTNMNKLRMLLGIKKLRSPRSTLKEIIKKRYNQYK